MQCPRCQFENIPGQDRCFKCNSVLEVSTGILEIHPPRMPAWERPWREVGRLSRRLLHLRPRKQSAKKKGKSSAEAPPVGGLILSIVPGLAHAMAGRFREIRLIWLVWLVFFVFGMFLYATPDGWVLLGLAAAAHAWIALKVDLLDYLKEFGARLIALLVLCLLLVLTYIITPTFVIDYQFARIPYDIPALDIQTGDLLVFRPLDTSTERPPPGTIVYFLAQGTSRSGRTVGQAIAWPGDTVVVTGEHFLVNGQVLDPNRIPVHSWLGNDPWTCRVEQDHVFIVSRFSLRQHGRQLSDSRRKQVCHVENRHVYGQAIRVWWPLTRRHRLPQMERYLKNSDDQP